MEAIEVPAGIPALLGEGTSRVEPPDLVVVELRGDDQVAGSTIRYRNHDPTFVRFRDGRVAHWRESSNPDVYRRATGE